MKPVIIGDATLYCGDCLEILPSLKGIDVVVTDPPYTEKTHQGALGDAGKTKLVTFSSISVEYFLDMSARLCDLSQRWVVMFCDWKHAAKAEDAGLPVIRCGCWIKLNPMPQMTGDRPSTGWEALLIMHRHGKKYWNGRGKPAVYYHGTSRYGYFGPSIHPTEKPISLCAELVKDFSDRGETVLDPYMGSGSTGVACVTSGRKFVGVEIDPDYFAIACARIEKAQRQQRMDFGDEAA